MKVDSIWKKKMSYADQVFYWLLIAANIAMALSMFPTIFMAGNLTIALILLKKIWKET